MSNTYKSFYLADLLAMIGETAIDCMMAPVFQCKKLDGTMMNMTELNAYNNCISLHNEGAREFAEKLKKRLQEDESSD